MSAKETAAAVAVQVLLIEDDAPLRRIPFALAFLALVRAMSLGEGRIVEMPLGVAYPYFLDGICAVICLVRFIKAPPLTLARGRAFAD